MNSTDELELKARVEDAAELERALRRAGATLRFRGTMIDRRYDKGGELEAKDEVLRLRVYQPVGGPAHGVLAWKGRASVRDGYKHREECETAVEDSQETLAILERLGYEVVSRIDREIAEYAVGGAVARIEWYPAMDVLLEVEGEPNAIERAIRATGLPREGFLSESLPHFVSDYERRTGGPARLAGDPS